MDTMELYRRAQDGFDAVLATVSDVQWDLPSACAEWTVRDVVGHVVWGQHQLRAWATGEAYDQAVGSPGTPGPGVLAGEDPLATWREARKRSVASLTEDALRRTTTLTGLGEIPLLAVVTLLTADQVAHTWDIGHGLGVDVRLDPRLVDVTLDWARANIVRGPGFFGPELTPPPEADGQSRMLAFLGRADWQPVPA
jgi:uncharacterized protein (TIGR03086 family)